MSRDSRRQKPQDDASPVYCVRLDVADAEEVDRRAAAERRPRSQFLRNLIHDALQAARRVVK